MASVDCIFILAMVLFLLTIQNSEARAVGQENCTTGTEYLEGIGTINCFALVDVAAGPVSNNVAIQKCENNFNQGKLVSVMEKKQLQIILDWALEEGLPNNSQSGFWMGFKRETPAAMPESGVLSNDLEQTRKNKLLYRSLYNVAPFDLWRNETQPGNALDERDEQCTAQSRPGKQPEYLGIDDYECAGKVLHYIICQVLMQKA
ncbi:uncharacterized protein LOC142344281 [Convolutriloba macropyga]|uniref:uncharacterized protein LOC142344281 n=1 Tax=Convolutriloba macropyga TaxID=536237 RepID=UPI003F5277BC